MAWKNDPADMGYDDEEMYDRAEPAEIAPAEYPHGLMFTLACDDLAKAGYEDGDPGDTCAFAMMATVTSCHRDMDGCRIELQGDEFAGEDGKFFDLEQPAHLCLERRELDKMGLDDDCEIGDMIHLIGHARLERTSEGSVAMLGDDGEMADSVHRFATLQVTALTYFEDESAENRGRY